MYRSYQTYPNYGQMYTNNDERFGFLGPFILGGIAGGLAAPLFYNGGYNNKPCCYNNYYYPNYPNYYYRPY
ncbi:MAG: hypothetical protein RSB77_02015 [Bacilli bacterium]